MMRNVITIPVDEVVPPRSTVLNALGISDERSVDRRTIQLADDGVSLYRELAAPTGVFTDISTENFEEVYRGEGHNESETPLENIFRSADSLALFAVTIGEPVSERIVRLFDDNDFPLGAALDAAASEGAELAAQALESHYTDFLKKGNSLDLTKGILRFSPGYCGWHISAQKKLFDRLNPGEIGISLRESFLMQPLKSISGVIVCGRKDIFYFDDSFPFCAECETRECRERIKNVMEQKQSVN
jgi:hypothetical protein